jgi:hypothetical protein
VSNAEQKEQGDRRLQAVPEVKPLQQADAQAARNAGASDVQAIQALNPNRHSGSAGGDQELSFELIAYGNEGFGKVVAARQQERLNARSDQSDLMDTGTMLAVEAKTNPAAEPVKLFKEWLNKQPESPQKEALAQEVRQQASDLSPEMKARMEHLAAIRRKIDEAGLEEGGIHQAITPEMASRTKLEGQVRHDQPLENTADGWLEAGRRISELPIDKQLQVIGSGLMAGYQQYQADERERTWGRIIGTTEGLGAVAVNLATIAEFTCDCIAGNKERAAERGGKFGEAVGQTIVSGVKLFQDADAYLFKVGFDGDYARPFRDLVTVGAALNDRWAQLPPREQERVKYKLITEMAADGLIGAGGAKAIGKAKVFTEVLDAIAIEAKAAGGAVKGVGSQVVADLKGMRQDVAAHGQHVTRYIQELLKDFTAPEMAIPGGGKVKFTRDLGRPADKPITNVLMSQADDLGGSGRLVSKGVDAAGKALKFSDESGIKLNQARLGQDNLWAQTPVTRGLDVHVGLGENLPANTKTIDRIHVKDGIATSIKSIEPRDVSYQQTGAFESKLRGYVHELEIYKGRLTKAGRGLQIQEDEIDEKVLHIGIPDGAISTRQVASLESIGKAVMEYNATKPFDKAPIRIEVTILK